MNHCCDLHMRVVLTTPPASEPLTAAEVKARLNIGSEVTDDVVNAYVKAARQAIDGWDGWLGRALINQSYTIYLSDFCSHIELPVVPAASITSVKYVDADGVEQAVDPSVYQLRPGNPPMLELQYGESWPSHRSQEDAVRIAYVAGYGSSGSSVPEPIRQAICLQVSQMRSLGGQNLFLSEDTAIGIGTKRYVVGGSAGEVLNSAAVALLQTYRVMRL